MALNDGGDAFPSTEDSSVPLTKRDYFAAAVFPALWQSTLKIDEIVIQHVVRKAYQVADAMLVERDRD